MYIRAYIHTYIHTYIRTYVHTYVRRSNKMYICIFNNKKVLKYYYVNLHEVHSVRYRVYNVNDIVY